MIKCSCGCKNFIKPSIKHKYRTPKFIQGHNRTGLISNSNPKSKSVRTGRLRAVKILKDRICGFKYIGHCKGIIDVCHIDQNPLNNDKNNLIALCRSHHRLMDNGRINIKKPVMPYFYVDSGGKRRY